MTRVSLVGTFHMEDGRTTVGELVAILERIRPKVIFLEMPAAAFDDHIVGGRSNLESTAVGRYREKNAVVLVPVDLPTPEREFFENSEYLYNMIEGVSPDYRRLVDWHRSYRRTYGFAYLNSGHCSHLLSEIKKAEQAAVATHQDPRLVDLYASWTRTNEHRDRAMIGSIEAYCVASNPSTSAFLVGAAHRQSLIDKLREEQRVGARTFEWDLSGFLEAQSKADR